MKKRFIVIPLSARQPYIWKAINSGEIHSVVLQTPNEHSECLMLLMERDGKISTLAILSNSTRRIEINLPVFSEEILFFAYGKGKMAIYVIAEKEILEEEYLSDDDIKAANKQSTSCMITPDDNGFTKDGDRGSLFFARSLPDATGTSNNSKVSAPVTSSGTTKRKFEDFTTLTIENEEQKGFKEQATSSRTPATAENDGSLQPKVEKNEEMQNLEGNGHSLKRPIHTPLYVGTASNHSKVLWEPYEAADVSAKIMSTENQVTPSQRIPTKPQERKYSVDSVSQVAVPGVHRSPETIEMPWATKQTLYALRDAGLIPTEDYTSVALDTSGPGPKSKKQESSADETTTNRKHRGPYARPGQPRPVWSVEDEPELVYDIQAVGQANVCDSKASVKYSEDEIDRSSRSNNGDVSGQRKKKNQTNVFNIDQEEYSSNA